MYNPQVRTAKTVSVVEFLPKLLAVSTQTTGNMIKLTMGTKSKMVHHQGRLMIFIKTTALYTGTKASQACRPALMYNFHVPSPCMTCITKKKINHSVNVI